MKLQKAVKRFADKWVNGRHPSYTSSETEKIMTEEIMDIFKKYSQQQVNGVETSQEQALNLAGVSNCNATLNRCECEEPQEEPIKICLNCNGYIE